MIGRKDQAPRSGRQGVIGGEAKLLGIDIFLPGSPAAEEHELTYAAMINKEGKTVTPAMASFQAAAANADWKSVRGYGLMLTDQPGEASWPITAASFILMQTVAQDAAEPVRYAAAQLARLHVAVHW